MDVVLLADVLMAAGSLIGLYSKVYALLDEDTVWSRRSSGVNVLTYPVTALAPMYILGLWFTLAVSFLNFLCWLGIFVYRSK